MRCAVIDIGSNSVKFLVAELGGNKLRVVHEQSIATRLAEHLIDTCELRPEAMARTLEALRQVRAEAGELGAEKFAAVATSAVRDSRNRRDFLRQARTVLGFPVRLLSGNEEAATIFAGVSADPLWRTRELFIVDVGGGSAEWVQGRRRQLEMRVSLPLGAVRLAERFLHSYPVAPDTAALLVATVSAQLAQPLARFQLENRLLVGTGGTATCLAAIDQGLADFDPHQIDHAILSLARLRELFVRFTGLTLDELNAIPGLPRKRADLIIPGTAVLLATLERLGATQLHISIRGLRYGVLTGLLQKEAPSFPAGQPAARTQPRALR